MQLIKVSLSSESKREQHVVWPVTEAADELQ